MNSDSMQRAKGDPDDEGEEGGEEDEEPQVNESDLENDEPLPDVDE